MNPYEKLRLMEAAAVLSQTQRDGRGDYSAAIETLLEQASETVTMRLPITPLENGNRIALIRQLRTLNPNMSLLECKNLQERLWPVHKCPPCTRFHEDGQEEN